jgi:hypothetical protein
MKKLHHQSIKSTFFRLYKEWEWCLQYKFVILTIMYKNTHVEDPDWSGPSDF